ncbi:hypothetical protein [Pseudomonas putida]|uniref:Uncharacterized protein n=1 Tax=Pseudomonas putida TaxID=303 RepID=A0A8I1ECU9_PSEPU|nr:hypothetical protein [Pseudomonas putida]MBI6883677.1 hypothetical protein [Pseudomonas putida]
MPKFQSAKSPDLFFPKVIYATSRIPLIAQSIHAAPEHLTDVIEATYSDLRATANPNHLVAAGWIAIPTDTTLDEAVAAKIFAAVGAWNQQKAA